MIDLWIDNSLSREYHVAAYGQTSQLKALSFDRYTEWISNNYQGPLSYMEGVKGQKRADVRDVYPFAKSAYVFLYSYTHVKKAMETQKRGPRFASYSFFNDKDYHLHIREHLSKVISQWTTQNPLLQCGIGVDTLPILERDLAVRAGLGWIGKNSMLIHPKIGSYTLIGAVFTSADANQGPLMTDHCGNCRACLDACPTDAILPQRSIDAKKCLSTWSIETFKESPAPKSNGITSEIYGCDICQEVCPWNKKPLLSAVEEELPWTYDYFIKETPSAVYEKLSSWSNRQYRKFFKGTNFERVGRVGMLKNFKHYLNR